MQYDPRLNSRIGQIVRCHPVPIISNKTHDAEQLSELGKIHYLTSTDPAFYVYQSGSPIGWASITCTFPITKAHPFDWPMLITWRGLGLFTKSPF